MDPITMTLFSAALFEVGKKLAEKGIVDPALEKGLEPFKSWLTKGYDNRKADVDLQKAFSDAIKELNAPVDEPDALVNWLKRVGLDRLQAPKNDELRRQVALAVLDHVEPSSPVPETLMIGLGWPRSQSDELAKLLSSFRVNLAKYPTWQPLLLYANAMQQQGTLSSILQKIGQFENVLVRTPAGDALRVVMQERGLSDEQLAQIEKKYRENLVLEFETHVTRGLSPAQMPKLIPLPLKDIYLELGLVPLRTDHEQESELQEILQADDAKRLMHEMRQQEKKVTDLIGQSQKLVIVGKPGSGKTMSLRFIALMLSYGSMGATRLRLDIPYVPIFVRLAQYAEELKKDSFLALETFLMEYVKRYYPGQPRQDEFLLSALDKGLCMVLLDGLDEVGDVGDTLIKGKTLRSRVIEEVERFTNRRCGNNCTNHVVVTSRLEGYHRSDLPGFTETELSSLSVPDEVQEFLLRWFAAYEQENHKELGLDVAFRKAHERVTLLMGDIMRTESVQRLAMNPLLLTILAMIHEMGTRLPNERVKLYQTVTKTMIENWRYEQTRHDISIYEVISLSRILPMMASLAYWVHENHPGGSMPEAAWRVEIRNMLLAGNDEEDEDHKVDELVEMFMRHAREEVGLLTERSPGQIGFFHLTLEEYLAAVDIARMGMEERKKRVKKYWADPYWREVILLAAGELIGRPDDLPDFINDLRMQDEGNDPNLAGRAALLAGLAITDVGAQNFENKKIVRDVRNELEIIAQGIDPETKEPSKRSLVSIQVRASAADIVDELGYVPRNLHTFLPISGEKYYLSKYLVTNLQYERFLRPENFTNKEYWKDFPKYDENSKLMPKQTFGSEGWDWLQKQEREEDGVLLPRYWRDPRFGNAHHAAPVVGISWYEASAYCRWLLENWDQLEEGKQGLPKPNEIRLPTENEWETAAGGIQPEERFAWGLLKDSKELTNFANTHESGINKTTPVWMYPQGASPHKLLDMSGNVWEWQMNIRKVKLDKKEEDWRAMRGGSWIGIEGGARVASRYGNYPNHRDIDVGFRVCALPNG